jgi:S1-C subfamily serine protease
MGAVRAALQALAVTFAAAFIVSACAPTGGTAAPGAASPTARGGSIPISSSPAVAPTGFEPAHVAATLGPTVGMIIVSTRVGTAEGTGFVVLNDGASSYMITNNHVIDGATKVQVLMPDGKHFVASVQGADPQGDIAVLKIPNPRLPRAELGDSTKVRVGQPVVAIGSALGNQGTVTTGIISSLHRTVTAGVGTTSETLPDVLQTDAAINPGNSGGPLTDAAGRVIGINTAGTSNANGINFAIPSVIAKRIADALIAGRAPGHPYLGVCTASELSTLARGQDFNGYGDMITKAIPGSAAEQAGLRAGDVIEKVDGVDLRNGQTLGGQLQLHNPGEQITITVLRGSSTVDVKVTLGDRPSITSNPC